MDISNYTTEDFVLDPGFRKWVLLPDPKSSLVWERIFEKHRYKKEEAQIARDIILHISKRDYYLSSFEFQELWRNLEEDLSSEAIQQDEKVIPLNAISVLKNQSHPAKPFRNLFLFRVACIILVALGFGFLSNFIYGTRQSPEQTFLDYEERSTVPGVKTHLTLSDGSKVVLNSGSKIRYVKNFEADKRELYLEGEAFFDVAKDSLRPFTVNIGEAKITALGTSFNVKAYKDEKPDIALLHGKVAVQASLKEIQSFILDPGEAIILDFLTDQVEKRSFDEELILGWTKKIILLNQTPLLETVRILENWYGVKIEINNKPNTDVFLSGKFQDENLKNVLEGLSYASDFDFTIINDTVKINF